MKRLILLLTALVSLSIYGAAQQTDTNTGSSAGGQTASDRAPIPADTSKDFWDGDDPNFANLITHPFASKKYVQRHTQPIRDRLNELDQLTSESSAQIKDVDARAQHGIQLASEKTSLADQHAADAVNKAQLAQTAATLASTRVGDTEQKISNLDQYHGTAQTEIHFRPGQSVLSKNAKDALDQMAVPLKDQHSYVVEVRGFSSGKGQAAAAASRRMADSVVRYLVLTHQIPVYRIYVMSMGNATAPGQTRLTGGRVDVSVLKNDLVGAVQR